MSEMQPPMAMPVGPIAGDLNCRNCGYNLRGLAIAQRCPECGTAVGFSVRGDLLRFSNPDWIRTLRRGMRVMLVAAMLLVAFVAASVFFTLARSPVTSPLFPLATLAAHALSFVGTWMATESDPGRLGEPEYGRLRRVIRAALLIGIGSAVVTLVPRLARLPADVATVLWLVTSLASIVGLVGECSLLVYLGRLAGRLPDDGLARRARTLAWTIGISYGAVLLSGLVVAPLLRRAAIARTAIGGTGGPPMPWVTAFGCVGGLAGLGLITSVVFYLSMLARFAQRLKSEEAAARHSWGDQPKGDAP